MAHQLFLTQRAMGPFAGALLLVSCCAWPYLTNIVTRRGHGAIKGRQNCISGTVGHTTCPEAITMGTNGSYVPLRFLGRGTMQCGAQINDAPATMGNGNVFHGCGKPFKTKRNKVPVRCTIRCM